MSLPATAIVAKSVLDQCSILEHAIKVRDLGSESAVAASLLKVRAERRVGQLLAAQVKHEGGRPKTLVADEGFAALAHFGITHDHSSKFQRLAAVPEERFETALADVAAEARVERVNVTRKAVMQAIDPRAERHPSEIWKDGDAFKRACDTVVAREAAALEAIRFGAFPGHNNADVFLSGALQSLNGCSGRHHQRSGGAAGARQEG